MKNNYDDNANTNVTESMNGDENKIRNNIIMGIRKLRTRKHKKSNKSNKRFRKTRSKKQKGGDGDKKHEIIEGKGNQTYNNGSYEGDFKDGWRHGKGIYTYDNGKRWKIKAERRK